MKSLLITVLLSVPAFAHIDPGVYKGTTPAGVECSMEAIQTYYVGSFKHPLNERVAVTVNGEKYEIQHPPVVSVTDQSAAFNHDEFQTIVPNVKGATALVVKMSHTPGAEGPTEYHFITHEYKNDVRTMESCLNLKL